MSSIAHSLSPIYYDTLYQLMGTHYLDLILYYEWEYDNISNRLSQKIYNTTVVPPDPSSLTSQENYSYYTFDGNTTNSQLLKKTNIVDSGMNTCYLWDMNGNLACSWKTTDLCPDVPLIPQSTCPGSPANEGDADYPGWLISLIWPEMEAKLCPFNFPSSTS